MGGARRTVARAAGAAADAGASVAPSTETLDAGTEAPLPPRVELMTFGSHDLANQKARSTALLLDDAAEALVAYARMALREAGPNKAAIPELVRTNVQPDCGGAAASARNSIEVRPSSQPCDAVVGALDAPAEAWQACELECALAAACAQTELHARAYAIVATCGPDESSAMQTLQRMAAACAHVGLIWSGGLVVTDAELIPRLMRAPRLGAWRRPVSEAIDTLIAAVRLNCSLDAVDSLLEGHAASSDSGGYLVASPNHLWRSVARLIERKS